VTQAEPTTQADARREPLSRGRIVEAALGIMDEEGLDAVTMRKIGRALGVEAMSLYNHVADKDDVLGGIVERVMSEFDPPPSEGNWREDAKNAAREWRRMLTRHPNVMTLMAERRKPLTTADSVRPMDAAIGVLRKAGLDVYDAAQSFHAFGAYIMGFVMMEQGMMLGHGDGDEDHLREHAEFTQMVAAGELPHLIEALPVLHECAPEDQFEFGLDLLVRGVESKLG
jgi:TetR/AcrR family transcriptional regulator, tetracycline repressor protein